MIPVIPPTVNDGIKPKAITIGDVNLILPPHMVSSQLNIFIPVGIAIAIVATANIEFAIGPKPTVNIWCAQTKNPRNAISTVAKTMEEYPNSLFLENVEMTSLNTPNAGKINIYTSGCPNIQNKCSQIITLPPIDGSKKFAPNKRSKVRRNRPIVNAGNANRIKMFATKEAHVNNGIRINVIPGPRIEITVTIKLIPAINVPNPAICKPTE